METAKKNTISHVIDKVSFVNNQSLLARATADTNEPVPGYLYQEIQNIARQPDPNCQLLVDYLSQRLDRPSAAVKMKVLKIMYYLIQNGPKSFRQHLRKKDGSIKMATSYQETPNPLTGTSTVEAVRKQSRELLQLLFDAQLMARDEDPQSQPPVTEKGPVLGGLGSSSAKSGKYEGFGNSLMHKEDTFAEKMLNTLERWASSPDHSVLIQEALSSPPDQYEPVTLDMQIPSQIPTLTTKSSKTSTERKVHIPGKAGGGWEDDPAGFSSTGFLEGASVASADSSEQGTVTNENSEVDVRAEASVCPETSLVQDFCTAGPLPCSLADIRSAGRRCTQMNVKEIVHAVVHVLETHLPEGDAKPSYEAGSSEVQLTRAMLLLEWLLRTDVVHPPTVAEMCCPPLSRIVSLHRHDSHDKPPPLKAKAEKLILILQKLQAMPF